MGTGDILLGVTLQWISIPSRGGGGVAAILLVASCYRNRDKLRPCGPSWLVCDLTYALRQKHLNAVISDADNLWAVNQWKRLKFISRNLNNHIPFLPFSGFHQHCLLFIVWWSPRVVWNSQWKVSATILATFFFSLMAGVSLPSACTSSSALYSSFTAQLKHGEKTRIRKKWKPPPRQGLKEGKINNNEYSTRAQWIWSDD